MHPRNNKHPSSYVKTADELLSSADSPIVVHLAKTGMDADDLAAAAGLPKIRLLKILNYGEVPDPFECYMLDAAFHFPQGQMLEEYTLWSEGS